MPFVEVVAFVESGSDVICVCWWQVGGVRDGLFDFLIVGGESGDGFGMGFHDCETSSDLSLDELHGLAVGEVERVVWS